MQQVVARNGFDGFRGSAVWRAVGVPRSIERRGQHAKRQRKGLVFFLHDVGQPLRAHPLELRLWKTGMQRHVRQQFQRLGKIPGERTRRDSRRVGPCARIQRGAQVRCAVRNLQSGARRRSLLQHPRRHACKPWPLYGIYSAPRVQHEIRCHQRQSRPFAVQHCQPIREFEFFRHRQVQCARNTRLRRIFSPLRVRVYRLAVVLLRILRRGLRRRHFRAQILLPRQPIKHRSLISIQLPLRKRRNRFGRGVFVSRNVRSQKVRRAQIMVVTVQAVRDASESSQRLQSRNDSRFDHVSRPRDFRRGRAVFAKRVHLRVDGLL